MALDKTTLKASMKLAFKAQLLKKSDPDAALDDLCDKLATAIDVYVKTATVNSGIPVSTAGTAVAQTGVTTGPGILS